MKLKSILVISYLIWSNLVFGQSKTLTFQYDSTDLENKEIVKTDFFDSQGKLLKEVYQGHKSSIHSGHIDGTYNYFYKDTLLKKRTFIDNEKDKEKVKYAYDDNGRLISEKRSRFEKRMKAHVNKGYGAKTCLISEKDYKKFRSWEVIDDIKYSYDLLGKKIESYSPLCGGSQNRYTWKYDSLNRVIEKISYDHKRVIWIKQFKYYNNEYKVSTTWYESDGSPSHLSKNSWNYHPIYTTTKLVNSEGNIIKKFVTTEKDDFRGRIIFSYNEKGNLMEKSFFNSNDKIVFVQQYVYK